MALMIAWPAKNKGRSRHKLKPRPLVYLCSVSNYPITCDEQISCFRCLSMLVSFWQTIPGMPTCIRKGSVRTALLEHCKWRERQSVHLLPRARAWPQSTIWVPVNFNYRSFELPAATLLACFCYFTKCRY